MSEGLFTAESWDIERRLRNYGQNWNLARVSTSVSNFYFVISMKESNANAGRDIGGINFICDQIRRCSRPTRFGESGNLARAVQCWRKVRSSNKLWIQASRARTFLHKYPLSFSLSLGIHGVQCKFLQVMQSWFPPIARSELRLRISKLDPISEGFNIKHTARVCSCHRYRKSQIRRRS